MKNIFLWLYYYTAVKFLEVVMFFKRSRINALRDENKELKRKLGIDE